MEEKPYYWKNNNLILNLQIQANASKNSIMREHNGRLKITVKSAPISGKANDELIKYLAKYFGIPKKQARITKGEKSKYKSVLISNPKINIDKFKLK